MLVEERPTGHMPPPGNYSDWYRQGPYAGAAQVHRPLLWVPEDRCVAAGPVQVMNTAPPAGAVVEPPVPEYALHLLLRSAPLLRVGFNRRPRWLAVSPGSMVLAPPDTSCEFIADEAAHVLTVAMPKEQVEEWGLRLDVRGEEAFRDPRLMRMVVELWQQAESEAPAGGLYADQALRRILGRLAERMGERPRRRHGREVLTHHVVRRLRDFVECHLAEELDVPGLARVAGLSPAHFARAFAASVGMTPFRYVMGRRLARAKELVEHTNRTALEIALEVGLRSPSHFSARFRQEYGETPGSARAATGRRAPVEEPPPG